MKDPNLCGMDDCQNIYTKILKGHTSEGISDLSLRLCDVHAEEHRKVIQSFNRENLSRGEIFIEDRPKEDA